MTATITYTGGRTPPHLTLLWVINPGGIHEAVEAAGGVALEASADFGVGFLAGSAAGEVGAGGAVVEHAPVDDDVQGSVELAVAEAVESWG